MPDKSLFRFEVPPVTKTFLDNEILADKPTPVIKLGAISTNGISCRRGIIIYCQTLLSAFACKLDKKSNG